MNREAADKKRTERLWKLYERLFNEEAPREKVVVHWGYEGMTVWNLKGATDGVVAFSFEGMADPADLRCIVHELQHVHDYIHLGFSEHSKEFWAEHRRLMKVAVSPRRS